MAQISRIVLIFGAILFLFLGVRSFTIPKSFGEYGFYRGRAPDTIAARPIRHAGKAACLSCHEELAKSPHVTKAVSCETCHGPGQAHVEDWEHAKLTVDTSREACGRCHNAIVARRDNFPQVDLKTHEPGKPCVSCHPVHGKEEAK